MADRRDEFVDDQLRARGYEVNRRESPGFFPNRHWHGGVELVVVHSGAVEFHFDDRLDLVAPGEAYLINGSVPHSPRALTERFDRTVLHFLPELAACAPGGNMISRVYQEGLGFKVALSDESLRRIAWAARELASLAPGPATRFTAEALLGLAVAEFEAASAVSKPPRPAILDAVLDYMARNVDSSETIPEIAARFAVSPRTLFNLFETHMDCSPKQHWTKLRLQYGCRLLSDTTWTVESVAMQTGFRSLRGFEQAFQRHVGMAPSEYRKRYGRAHVAPTN